MTTGVHHAECAEIDGCRPRPERSCGRLYATITYTADVAIDSERAGIAVFESHVAKHAEHQSECSPWITAAELTTPEELAAKHAPIARAVTGSGLGHPPGGESDMQASLMPTYLLLRPQDS
jgi:hypothetical protein